MSLTPRRRHDDRWPHRVWRWMRRVLVTIGAMVLISAVMMTLAAERLAGAGRAELRDKMVLAYILDEELAETAAPPSLANPRLVPRETVQDVVEALRLAAGDSRVAGIVIRADGMSLTLANVQEIRTAVLALRQAGKFAWIYANDYGGAGAGGAAPYYLASAFGQIWLQPVGAVGLPGIAFQVPFFRDLMARFGVEADMIQKGRYKSAPESLTASSMSDAARANLTAVLQNVSQQVRDDIAVARNLAPEAVDAAMARAVHGGDAAVAARLIDRVGYADEMVAAAKAATGMKEAPDDKFFTPLLAYADARVGEKSSTGGMVRGEKAEDEGETAEDAPAATASPRGKSKIAVIHAVGQIVDDRANPGMAGTVVTPDMMREAFAAVRRDRDVAAIVLRLDTPGGSAFASESIRRLVQRAQADGTPVVASMGSVAASGGYWIAAAADRIVANPATLTGSIGVFGGKVVIGETLQNWGINVETLRSGPSADIWSALRPFSEAERATVDGLMQETYDGFIARVAAGRKLDAERVEELAGGQVFSGQQAKANGLVDTLGGFDVAVMEARRLSGIAPDAHVEISAYPAPRGIFQQITAILSGEAALPGLNIRALLDMQQPALLAPVTGVH
jgi:protease-4